MVNGTEKSTTTFANGDPKKESECDISSSDNSKIITNGAISSDSDDTKSNKSEESYDIVIPTVCPIRQTEDKPIIDKKKENKKTKANDKSSDSDKKKIIIKNKSVENKKDNEERSKDDGTEKINGDNGKAVNGDGDRESSPSEDGDDKKRDAEVVFIQDLGFTVKIVSPGAEPLDIQVLSTSFIVSYCMN